MIARVTKKHQALFGFLPKSAWCFLVTLAVITSCGYRMERDPDVVVASLLVEPANLNPVLMSEIAAYEITDKVYDSLLTLNYETLELAPSLAEKWEISPDGLTFVYHLRNDVKWHDGKPFTADDVVFTFEAVKDKRVNSALIRGYLVDLESVKKVSDYEVVFKFSKPYFRTFFTLSMVKIVPKHIFFDIDKFNKNSANRSPIGTGPMKLKKWVGGRSIELIRNDEYFGERPGIKGITYKIVPSNITSFFLLKKTATDFNGGVSPVQWKFQTGDAEFNKNFTKHEYYLPNYSFVGWNMRRPLFSDVRVRRALSYLIDRKSILDNVLFGEGVEITGPLYFFGKNYNSSLQASQYDPEAAQKLLEEAGWNDTNGDGIIDKDNVPFKFTVIVRSSERFGRSIALLLKKELAKVGIDMKIQELEWATMIGFLKRHDFDAIVLGMAMPVNEDPFGVWHSSQMDNGSNFFGFNNVRADKILEEARATYDDAKRASLYNELHAIIYDEQPCAFLYMLPTLAAVAKRFDNVNDYKAGLKVMEWRTLPWNVLYEW